MLVAQSLFGTSWTVALQMLLYMEFSRRDSIYSLLWKSYKAEVLFQQQKADYVMTIKRNKKRGGLGSSPVGKCGWPMKVSPGLFNLMKDCIQLNVKQI